MSIFTRVLDLPDLPSRASFFLPGPRVAGTRVLVQGQLADRTLVIDLLHARGRPDGLCHGRSTLPASARRAAVCVPST
jgi:hypothetical protein